MSLTIILQTNAGNEPDLEDEQVCCEAMEVMTLCFALIPTALDTLSKEKDKWGASNCSCFVDFHFRCSVAQSRLTR